MATTYKFLTSGVETLTANVFADQIEIYDGHPLDPCTEYVWFHDDRLGNDDSVTEVQGPTRIGAGGNTYDVDLSSVANSGDYWCEIRVGTTEDCWIRTETRTISIIECVSPQNRTLAATGASATASVRHPHYETPVFSNEGNTWIVPGNFDICDTQVDHVCLSVQSYTLTDQDPSANSARRGQATITVGTLVCFYGIVQDYIPAAPDAPAADPAPGPFISLSQDGPSLINNPITVTAATGVVGGTLANSSILWSTGETTDSIMVDSATAGTQTITATVTDTDTSLTATTNIDVIHTALPVLPISTVTGDIIRNLNTRTIWGQPPLLTQSGIITVGGGGNWFIRATINPQGFFMGETGVYSATLTVNGPGVNLTQTLTTGATQTTQEAFEMEFEATTGTYNWTYAWDPVPNALPSNQVNPTASVHFFPRFF